MKAAGVLFRTNDDRVLFLKRGPSGDFPGYWCLPGGKVEDGETAEEGARREALEETGTAPGDLALLARSIKTFEVAAPAASMTGAAAPAAALPLAAPEVDFTTFLARVSGPFGVIGDNEHVGWAWAPADDPPAPLHPGCAISLARLKMNELDVARAMVAGDLTSPQRYKNMMLWAIRITGTGVAYRRAKRDAKGKLIRGEEFPLRRPELYLTDDFLARCNGLPVVWMHPEKSTLDSVSYAESNVGSVMLPYIQGNEVWAIARVYDDAANAEMAANRLSTSPGVLLSADYDKSFELTTQDGATLLVEGDPSLLDHIAICSLGVWDKGGDPAGVSNHDLPTEIAMADSDDKDRKDAEEKDRKDAAEHRERTDATLNKVLSCMDSMMNRMDAFESKDKERDDSAKKDAEEKAEAERLAADKTKKDAEEKAEKDKAEEEEKKADMAKKDADDAVVRRIADLESKLPQARSDEDINAMTDVQSRIDAVESLFGRSAPRYLNGEGPREYRVRLLRGLQTHSPAWKEIDLSAFKDDAALAVAETHILNDARVAAMNPADVEDGGLRMVEGKTPSGHRENKFYGKPGAWLSRFGGSRRFVTRLNPTGGKELN